MRKIFIVAFFFSLLVTLTGCGGSKPDLTKSTVQPSVQTQQDQKAQPSQQPEVKASSTPAPQTSTSPSVKSTPPAQTQKQEITVFVTRTGSKYHRAGCRYLAKSQIPMSLSAAKSSGYGPCSVCGPPR